MTEELENLKKSLVDGVFNYPIKYRIIYTCRVIFMELYPELFRNHNYFMYCDKESVVQDYYNYIKLFKWPKEPECVEETHYYMALLCRIIRQYERQYVGKPD